MEIDGLFGGKYLFYPLVLAIFFHWGVFGRDLLDEYKLLSEGLDSLAAQEQFEAEKIQEQEQKIINFLSSNRKELEIKHNVDIESTISRAERRSKSLIETRKCIGNDFSQSQISSLSIKHLIGAGNRDLAFCSIENNELGLNSNVEIIDEARKTLLRDQFVQNQKQILAYLQFEELVKLDILYSKIEGKKVSTKKLADDLCSGNACPEEFLKYLESLQNSSWLSTIERQIKPIENQKEAVNLVNIYVRKYNSALEGESNFQLVVDGAVDEENSTISTLRAEFEPFSNTFLDRNNIVEGIFETETLRKLSGDIHRPFERSDINYSYRGKKRLRANLKLNGLKFRDCKEIKKMRRRSHCKPVDPGVEVVNAYKERRQTLISNFKGSMNIDSIDDLLRENELLVMMNLSTLDYNPIFIICEDLKRHFNINRIKGNAIAVAENISNALDVVTLAGLASGGGTLPAVVLGGSKKILFRNILRRLKGINSPIFVNRGFSRFPIQEKVFYKSLNIAGASDLASRSSSAYATWQKSHDINGLMVDGQLNFEGQKASSSQDIKDKAYGEAAEIGFELLPVVPLGSLKKVDLNALQRLPKGKRYLAMLKLKGLDQHLNILKILISKSIKKLGLETTKKIYDDWSFQVDSCIQ